MRYPVYNNIAYMAGGLQQASYQGQFTYAKHRIFLQIPLLHRVHFLIKPPPRHCGWSQVFQYYRRKETTTQDNQSIGIKTTLLNEVDGFEV